MKNFTLLLLILIGPSFAAAPGWRVAEIPQPAETTAAATCSQWVRQENGGDYWSTAALAQGIKITNTTTICQIAVKVSTGGVSKNVGLGFWSTPSTWKGVATNTYYGGSVTNNANYADVSPGWVTNTCSIVLSNDCYLGMWPVSPSDLRWISSTTNTYENTSYFATSSSTVTHTAEDYCFVIWTQ